MAALKSKKIVVAGDLIVDHDFARLPGRGGNFHAPCTQTLLTHAHGGAWYLADTLNLVLGSPAAAQSADRPKVYAPKQIPLGGKTVRKFSLGNAFSVWQLIEAGKDKVWRVEESLGCQGPAEETTPVPRTDDPADPDVLVLEEMGLGFASNPKCWPAALKEGGAPQAIVVKASASFDCRLWEEKLLKPGLAEKVTIVASAHVLRAMGAKLSRALSWDQTVEDLIREFEKGQSAFLFRAVKRVVVLFGTEGVAVFSRLPRGPQEPAMSDGLRFERLVYDPEFLEGDWRAKHKGTTYGGQSVLTAAVARHELQGRDFPLFFAICRALEGMRAVHEMGGGKEAGNLHIKASANKLRQIFTFPEKKGKKNTKDSPKVLPENHFRAAFPRDILSTEQSKNQCILTDVTGEGLEFITAKAEEIVLNGVDKALKAVPRARYGGFVTVDREEIERINSIRNLIMDYRSGKDTRPLSIAVFGQPGSGKSFAIKQLAEELFGKEKAVLEFNLSQFESVHDLHEALHQVRDKSLEGKIPFVFWDEFDSCFNKQPLGWLKEFLSPMQDAKFQSGGVVHPLGRAIFVFAGGTRTSFKAFAMEEPIEARTAEQKKQLQLSMDAFKDAKAPDFISRLRGYVDIKGPNPVMNGPKTAPSDDHAYPIRRAMLLRSMLKRYFRDSIIDPHTGRAEISPGVLAGFLRVEKYLHGARSMEALVSMSHLRNARYFGPADLPPQELLDLHTSPDFMETVEKAELAGNPLKRFVEKLAEEQHEGYYQYLKANNYTYGPVRNDEETKPPKTHPMFMHYNELNEAGKEKNLAPARLALARLAALEYRIVQAVPGLKGEAAFTETEKKHLSISEHKRWMREKLVEGYAFIAKEKNDPLRLHVDIQPFESLPEKDKHLDDDLIGAIFRVAKKMGLAVVKKK